MNQLTQYFMWGFVMGGVSCLWLGCFMGAWFATWTSSRSEYAKMKREFEERRKVVRDSIDAARKQESR